MDWSGFVPGLIATFAGVILAFFLEDYLAARRATREEAKRDAEWAALRVRLVDDVNAQGDQLHSTFIFQLDRGIREGDTPLGQSPIHANVLFDDDLWRAIGGRYATVARDPVEARAFERFYRLVGEMVEAYLRPGFTVEARAQTEMQRGFRIQEAMWLGRDIAAKYGTEEQQAKAPDPEQIGRAVDQARKQRDEQAARVKTSA